MSVLQNLISKFNVIPSKILERYFVRLKKLILKFIWRGKGPRSANTTLKNKDGGLTLSDFKIYKKAIVIRAM
jgi:hypothetical protein